VTPVTQGIPGTPLNATQVIVEADPKAGKVLTYLMNTKLKFSGEHKI
jgi:hypothetical protein